MTQANTNKFPKQAEGLTSETLPDDEIMILKADKEIVHILNPVASVLWDLFDGAHSVDDLCAIIHETMPDQSLQLIGKDIKTLIDDLINKGLLETRD